MRAIRCIIILFLINSCYLYAQDEIALNLSTKRAANLKVELGIKYGINLTSLIFTPAPYDIDIGYDLGQSVVVSLNMGSINRQSSFQTDLGYLNNRSTFSFRTDSSVQTYTMDMEYFKFPLFYKRTFSFGHYYSKHPPEIYYMMGAELSYLLRGRMHLKETGYVVIATEDVSDYLNKVEFSWVLALGFNIAISNDLIFCLEGGGSVGFTDIDNSLFHGFAVKQIYYQISTGFYYLFPNKHRKVSETKKFDYR